jgi:hypothetical protein
LDTFQLASALAAHIEERTTTRELLDLHVEDAESYFREHRIKQPITCIGDALVQHADRLGIVIYKLKASKYDISSGKKIEIDRTLSGRMAFGRQK